MMTSGFLKLKERIEIQIGSMHLNWPHCHIHSTTESLAATQAILLVVRVLSRIHTRRSATLYTLLQRICNL